MITSFPVSEFYNWGFAREAVYIFPSPVSGVGLLENEEAVVCMTPEIPFQCNFDMKPNDYTTSDITSEQYRYQIEVSEEVMDTILRYHQLQYERTITLADIVGTSIRVSGITYKIRGYIRGDDGHIVLELKK